MIESRKLVEFAIPVGDSYFKIQIPYPISLSETKRIQDFIFATTQALTFQQPTGESHD